MVVHQTTLSRGGTELRTDIRRGGAWEPHFHKSFELIYVISGEVCCAVGGRAETARTGDAVLCLSNEIHSGRAVGDAEFFVCIFTGELVPSFAKAVNGKLGDRALFTPSASVGRYLEENFIRREPSDILMQKSCLYALLSEYLRAVTLSEHRGTGSDAMTRIIDYVSENYTRDVRLSDVAEVLSYDYHYVSRLFHRLFGMAFSEFLTIYRLEHASELMESGEKKLVDVAYESGFQSVRTFNKSFRAHYGMTPSEYRRLKTLKNI